jgi:hypothetical protein
MQIKLQSFDPEKPDRHMVHLKMIFFIKVALMKKANVKES